MLLAIANCARRAETVIVIPEIPTEAEIRIATGEVRKIKLIAGALPWQGNPVVPLLLQDITDLKLIQQRLHILAVTDQLTVAFNRRHAFNIGHALFKEGVAASSKVALAVFDVDHFKRLNDTYGHSAGDAASKALTQSIQTLIAAEAASRMTFARVGGDEFTILLGPCSQRQCLPLTGNLGNIGAACAGRSHMALRVDRCFPLS
ncbi:GGDEF domain-containing protein [Rhizobium leguminosarum]|uniref:GGDEF domain-containing protein n=1 Tax=Rhizobium leguminosarum TaxID=384 RepID=UPI001C95C98E|nr:GGDEF domain-containing protein [Rhizobium leguminosarum]MBY5393239.1 GGDEF domain-containing protein [Rhizobium leguminosarum]